LWDENPQPFESETGKSCSAWCKTLGEGVDDVEWDMTQPAKVQEPSMEEILASIRRIIADDEAKPAEKGANPAAAKPAVMTNIPPSAIAAAQAAPAKASPPAPAAAPPAAANSQDDIDAMLAGLDAATSEAEVRPPLPDGDVFELTDEMALPDEQPASFRRVDPEDDLEFSEAVAASAPQRRQPAFEPPPLYETPAAPPQQMQPQQILSRSTVSAVESAFNTLANTVLSNNARTLEDLVKEMLRPMLKSWLDDNLPGLVERIVKAEIERVSRGR
jgi:cell pole-organizing protein PopZ